MNDFNFKNIADLKKQQILKGFVENDIEKSEESFEKARHGVYADNAENQRLHRVGQEYGTKGKDEQGGSKTGGKSEESSDKEGGSDGKLSEHAKNASEEALNRAIKNSTDPKIREAAHEELKRRESEEKKVESQEEFNEKNDTSKKIDENEYKNFLKFYDMEDDKDSILIKMKSGETMPYKIVKSGEQYVLKEGSRARNYMKMTWNNVKTGLKSAEDGIDFIIKRHNKADSYMNWGKIYKTS